MSERVVPTTTYTLGARVVSQKRGATISHLLPDGHGSTRQLADGSGSVTARYTFDAYGKGLDFTNSVQNPTTTPLLYSGERLDADVQQYHLQARYYNPAVGRFGQIDPFSPQQQSGANLYAYAADDPVNNTDPTGLYEIDVHQFLTRYLGENAGLGVRAETLGLETQRLDAPGDSRDAMGEGLGNRDNMEAFHFVSEERLAELWTSAFIPGRGRGSVHRNIGEYLHALEDTYSHSTGVGDRNWEYYGNMTVFGFTLADNGGYTGHGHLGHEPDHTWRDVEKAMNMAAEVYLRFVYFGIDNSSPGAPPAHADWTAIRRDVQEFMEFRPNVYTQTYLNFVNVENATFDGYNAKIHLLNAGYNIDESVYANPNAPVFAKVTGRRPSKTIAGATGGFSMMPTLFNPLSGVGLGFGIP